MKHACILCLSVCLLAACATSPDTHNPFEDKNFSYFFPTDNQTRHFNSLEEAQHFVESAQKAMRKSCGKNVAKGLTAKLQGPRLDSSQPVTVGYFIVAGTDKGMIKTRGLTSSLEGELKKAISVSLVFLVFFEDRAVASSSYYLHSDYVYNSNSQYDSFTFNNMYYKADYPVGWNIAKGIEYLRGDR